MRYTQTEFFLASGQDLTENQIGVYNILDKGRQWTAVDGRFSCRASLTMDRPTAACFKLGRLIRKARRPGWHLDNETEQTTTDLQTA